MGPHKTRSRSLPKSIGKSPSHQGDASSHHSRLIVGLDDISRCGTALDDDEGGLYFAGAPDEPPSLRRELAPGIGARRIGKGNACKQQTWPVQDGTVVSPRRSRSLPQTDTNGEVFSRVVKDLAWDGESDGVGDSWLSPGVSPSPTRGATRWLHGSTGVDFACASSAMDPFGTRAQTLTCAAASTESVPPRSGQPTIGSGRSSRGRDNTVESSLTDIHSSNIHRQCFARASSKNSSTTAGLSSSIPRSPDPDSDSDEAQQVTMPAGTPSLSPRRSPRHGMDIHVRQSDLSRLPLSAHHHRSGFFEDPNMFPGTGVDVHNVASNGAPGLGISTSCASERTLAHLNMNETSMPTHGSRHGRSTLPQPQRVVLLANLL